MKKSHTLILVLFFAVSLAGLLLFPQIRNLRGESTGSAVAKTPARVAVPVVVAKVASEPFTEKLEALGTTKANESVEITPTVEERVVEVFFEDGDTVRQGQVLVKLDDGEARFRLAEAKATLREQRKQFERIRKLTKTRSTSRSKLDEEQSLLEIAKARVALLEVQLKDYKVRAPFSGVLGIRQVSSGAVVDSDTVITTLDDTTVIKLDFTIPETYIGVLQNGMEISAQSPAYPDRVFSGSVSAISSRVDPETRSLTVRARIPNPDRLLKPGMLLTVNLVKESSWSLIVPEEAVILEKGKKFSLVVTSENTVEKKEIVTGRRSPGKVEVINGLDDGDRVITEGITRVRPGISVKVVETRETVRLSG